MFDAICAVVQTGSGPHPIRRAVLDRCGAHDHDLTVKSTVVSGRWTRREAGEGAVNAREGSMKKAARTMAILMMFIIFVVVSVEAKGFELMMTSQDIIFGGRRDIRIDG